MSKDRWAGIDLLVSELIYPAQVKIRLEHTRLT